MKLNTKYSINESVYIIPLKSLGKIEGLFYSTTGLSYNIRYFDGLKPSTCYFTEDELSYNEPKVSVGFSK